MAVPWVCLGLRNKVLTWCPGVRNKGACKTQRAPSWGSAAVTALFCPLRKRHALRGKSFPHEYVNHPETWSIASLVIRRFTTNGSSVWSREWFASFLCSIRTLHISARECTTLICFCIPTLYCTILHGPEEYRKEGKKEERKEGGGKEMGFRFRELKVQVYSGSWRVWSRSLQRSECSQRERRDKSWGDRDEALGVQIRGHIKN